MAASVEIDWRRVSLRERHNRWRLARADMHVGILRAGSWPSTRQTGRQEDGDRDRRPPRLFTSHIGRPTKCCFHGGSAATLRWMSRCHLGRGNVAAALNDCGSIFSASEWHARQVAPIDPDYEIFALFLLRYRAIKSCLPLQGIPAEDFHA